MSALKNSVRLTGFLGMDPEIVLYGDNQKMARISLATHEAYRNKGNEWVTDTHWHTLIYWGKSAEYAEKTLKKGHQVSIEGRLLTNNYVDKEGNSRSASEVVVNDTLLVRVKNRKGETWEPEEEDAGGEEVSGEEEEMVTES